MALRFKHIRKAQHKKMLCFFSVAFLTVMMAIPAQAQQDTNNRLNRLENEIQTLSRALFKGEQPPAGAFSGGGSADPAIQANIELRLSQMEIELRTLTGRFEEQAYEMRQLQNQVNQLVNKIEMMGQGGGAQIAPSSINSINGTVVDQRGAVGVVDTGAGSAPKNLTGSIEPSAMDAGVSTQGQAPVPPANLSGQLGTLNQSESGEFTQGASQPNNPNDLYARGFSLLRDQNYDEAEKIFQSFLNQYPDHNLAPNAQYWLGETYYVRENFERAARIFAESYQKYPKGPKGPDNLLKLALSLAGLDKKADACLTLSELQRQYPTGANPVLARAESEKTRLGCP